MADEAGLSKETFLQMATLHGIDTGDDAHMEELYASVKDIMGTIAQLRDLDLGDTEPANIFSPAAE